MSALPFKLNQDRRRHIPEQKRRVTNWREYDESLRRCGSLTVWFSDEAIGAWKEPWCTDQACGRTGPYPGPGSGDADGPRASELQHAVEHVDGHVHLGRA